MAGIYRTVATEVLRQSIRAGGMNSIMFPRDPIRTRRRSSLICELFPPAQNRFLFGPFIKLGWGTPSLITGSLGVILEPPDPVRILILGQVKVALPVPELPLVSLNLDVLGIIDFGEQMLSLDASLYDSRVTIYSVYGDMALRLSWGEQPIFALSIGGLHPQFKPPPNFRRSAAARSKSASATIRAWPACRTSRSLRTPCSSVRASKRTPRPPVSASTVGWATTRS